MTQFSFTAVRRVRLPLLGCCLLTGVLLVAAGCGGSGGTGNNAGGTKGGQKGQINMTVDEFRKAAFNKDNYGQWEPKKTFFDKFGDPARISDVGDDTYLYYDCKDGKVRVKCVKTSFQRDDTINATAVDRE